MAPPGPLLSARTPAPARFWSGGPSPRTDRGAPLGVETRSKERASEQEGGRGWEEQPANLGAGRASRGGSEAAAGGRSYSLLSRSGSRAAANHPLPNSRAESGGPGSLSRASAPSIAREAATGAPEWCALGPGRRRKRRRRTDFQGPLPRPRPPTCPRPRPPPSCAQWVHSFLRVSSANICRVPTGCPAPGRPPRGCGGRNPWRPPLPGLAVRTGKEARAGPLRFHRGGGSWGSV